LGFLSKETPLAAAGPAKSNLSTVLIRKGFLFVAMCEGKGEASRFRSLGAGGIAVKAELKLAFQIKWTAEMFNSLPTLLKKSRSKLGDSDFVGKNFLFRKE
jgi:hypothetical protein